MSTFLIYVIIGITAGSIYGLIGIGIVLTFRTSGFFNFAQGALATAGSYFFYELWVRHGLPWPLAAVLTILFLGVVFGVGLEALSRRLSGVTQNVTIVATIGLLLIIEDIATVRYGGGTITLSPFLPTSTFRVFGVNVTWGQLIVVLIGIATSAGLTLMLNRTRIGIAMRGVVDDPDLIEVTGIDAKSVRRVAWILGGGVAVLSGVLIAPTVGLNPLLLTELVIQAFGAAAIGRFKSLPMTFVGGWIIAIGASLIQGYTTNYPSLQGIPSSLPFIVLFVVLIVAKRGSLPTTANQRRSNIEHFTAPPVAFRVIAAMAACGLVVAIPYFVGAKLPVYISGAGFIIVFLSLGLLIQLSGQISLCQGAFVAIGAVAFSHLNIGLGVPWPIALLGAGLVAAPVGALIAIPAIRVSGLYLALATFAFGILMQNLVYTTFLMFGSAGHQIVNRPKLAGLDVSSDQGYFYVAMAIAACAIAVVIVLQRSRLGRLLRGLADSPVALTSFGVGVNTTLVVVFFISAFLAGIGGAVLAAGTHAAGPADYSPLNSLLWVVVLAISGRQLIAASVVAAALLAVVPVYLPQSWINYEPIGFGVLAIAATLLVSSNFDLAARVKSSLASTVRTDTWGPVKSRGRDVGWRSPLSRRGANPLRQAERPETFGSVDGTASVVGAAK